MLVAIALDKSLADVKELVEDPSWLIAEIMQILQAKQAHPVLAQWSTQICARIYQSPNLLQPPQPAAAAARENEPNLSHKTDFSELSKQTGYCQRGRPPSKSQPTWKTHGWIGAPTHANWHPTSRVTLVLGSAPGTYRGFGRGVKTSNCKTSVCSVGRCQSTSLPWRSEVPPSSAVL